MPDLIPQPAPHDPFAPKVVANEAGESVAHEQDSRRVAEQLAKLVEAASEDGLMDPTTSPKDRKFEKQLVKARLGSAAGLFAATRCKHPATAQHCLRVALVCSGWSAAAKLSDDDRNTLEVAAILHDIGKIGVPDSILSKPGRLMETELATMATSRPLAVDVLSAAGRRKR